MIRSRRAVPFVLAMVAVLGACGSESPHVVTTAERRDAGAAGDDGTDPVPDASVTTTEKGDAAVTAEEHHGEATYYDANGTGACGFKASTDYYVVAMNGTDYERALCGKCIAVTGPKDTVTVRITDECPGCKAGGLDLSITAFTKIASKSDGRVDVSWHFVDCP